jgi:hypothetical protein
VYLYLFLPLLCFVVGVGSTQFVHNGWGLLLMSNFVFISSTFYIDPFCVFKFLGLFSYIFLYWSAGILSSFSCSSFALSFISSCIGLLRVVKVIASMGLFSLRQLSVLKPGF